MVRTSGEPHVKLRLLRSISLKILPHLSTPHLVLPGCPLSKWLGRLVVEPGSGGEICYSSHVALAGENPQREEEAKAFIFGY